MSGTCRFARESSGFSLVMTEQPAEYTLSVDVTGWARWIATNRYRRGVAEPLMGPQFVVITRVGRRDVVKLREHVRLTILHL